MIGCGDELSVGLSDLANDAADMKGVILFTAMTIAGAKVFIPHEPVPFTLQTLFVVLSGAFLGFRGGVTAMFSYLLLGAAGLPVFAGSQAGFGAFAGPTAGYLFGFVLSAGVVGATIRLDDSIIWTVLSLFAGFATIFACGTVWLNSFYLHDWHNAIGEGLLIFSFWDLIKLAAAVAVYRAFNVRDAHPDSPSIHLKHKSEVQFSRRMNDISSKDRTGSGD